MVLPQEPTAPFAGVVVSRQGLGLQVAAVKLPRVHVEIPEPVKT